MCGIFVITNEQPGGVFDDKLITDHRRGPEQTQKVDIITPMGYKVQTVFHRLAINGLDTDSCQPFVRESITLLCNGEIYNYVDLLKQVGGQETRSDCEALLLCYLKYGIEKTIQMIYGVYAFIIIDGDKIIAGCGPFGLRPLYRFRLSGGRYGYASEIKQIIPNGSIIDIQAVPPFSYETYDLIKGTLTNVKYFSVYDITPQIFNTRFDAQTIVRQALEEAVKKRVVGTTERPVACLLSGGLDSSLIAALTMKFLRESAIQNDKPAPVLETYCIGMEGSTDMKYAKIVAKHIGSKHTEVLVSADTMLNAIPRVIEAIESFDTTTVRASVGNFLVAEYISKNSNAKVIMNGDGSDEVAGGYMYEYHAPTDEAFDMDCKRLLSNIHSFDVLRSDRSISDNGLEPRTPFLDINYVRAYLSVPTEWRRPGKQYVEKQLLRDAFADTNILPHEVLYRTKEAFSDGVSSVEKSWFLTIKEYLEQTDLDIPRSNIEYTTETQEQIYYREIYTSIYGDNKINVPYYWMPNFITATDASARTWKPK